jgi:hypothetical protein
MHGLYLPIFYVKMDTSWGPDLFLLVGENHSLAARIGRGTLSVC